MSRSRRNPLQELERRIEAEVEEFRRRRLAEEIQKLADDVPAVSPPGQSAEPSAPPLDHDPDSGR